MQQASKFKVTRIHEAANLFWCVGETRCATARVDFAKILKVKRADGSLNLPALLQSLWDEGLRSVMVEGGAVTASKFLKAGLVNRLYLFQAPILIGAETGRSWTESFGISEMKERRVLIHPQVLNFEGDLLVTGRLS